MKVPIGIDMSFLTREEASSPVSSRASRQAEGSWVLSLMEDGRLGGVLRNDGNGADFSFAGLFAQSLSERRLPDDPIQCAIGDPGRSEVLSKAYAQEAPSAEVVSFIAGGVVPACSRGQVRFEAHPSPTQGEGDERVGPEDRYASTLNAGTESRGKTLGSEPRGQRAGDSMEKADQQGSRANEAVGVGKSVPGVPRVKESAQLAGQLSSVERVTQEKDAQLRTLEGKGAPRASNFSRDSLSFLGAASTLPSPSGGKKGVSRVPDGEPRRALERQSRVNAGASTTGSAQARASGSHSQSREGADRISRSRSCDSGIRGSARGERRELTGGGGVKASLLSLRAKSAGRENVGRAMRTISLEEGTRVRTGSRGEKNPETWWSAALAKSGTSGAMPQVSSVSASSARAWNTTDVLNQIVGRLAIAVEESSSRAQLVLRPPELGRVVMDLNLNSSQLDLTVSVEHPHVKELLQSSISELEAALREKGLELGTFSIGVDLGTERRDSSSHAGRSSQGVRRAGVTMPVQPGGHAETGTVRAVWEPWLGNAGIDCFA